MSKKAINYVQNFKEQKLTKGLASHRKWWTDYFAASTLELPDTVYQQFYDMQLYKLASATRSDKPAMDLQGPGQVQLRGQRTGLILICNLLIPLFSKRTSSVLQTR
jgi:hypothetical protein